MKVLLLIRICKSNVAREAFLEHLRLKQKHQKMKGQLDPGRGIETLSYV